MAITMKATMEDYRVLLGLAERYELVTAEQRRALAFPGESVDVLQILHWLDRAAGGLLVPPDYRTFSRLAASIALDLLALANDAEHAERQAVAS